MSTCYCDGPAHPYSPLTAASLFEQMAEQLRGAHGV